jgi:hypothetical protein
MVGAIALTLLLLARSRRTEIAVSALILLLCVWIECTQFLLGYSTVFEWWDVRDDLLGLVCVFAGIQLMNLLARL